MELLDTIDDLMDSRRSLPPDPELTSQSKRTGKLQVPWIEKYRPTLLCDIVGNSETIKRFEVFAKQGNLPNIILAGPPGTGKTTSILCLARAMLGDSFSNAVLELNASDERGIDVVRSRIKGFSQQRVTLPQGKHKIVILDEADSMTSGAQQAMRRIMEVYSRTTRFALACNDSEKIIEAIQSRCAVLRYSRLSDAEILSRLLEICNKEKVSKTDEGLEAIVFTAQGDMRQGINNLQSTHTGFGLVNSEYVFKICDEPHPLLIKQMLLSCIKGELTAAHKVLYTLWSKGYSSEDIISTVFRVCKNLPMTDIAEFQKLEFIKEIGMTHLRISEGLGTLLQLSGLVARLCALTYLD
ncbi:Replication factor C subunit 2 [Oopsacas minuta]|uniref:Replication factor C subunit 2 n=1 Tax=Oopsacas minuta TaxID=111878 RepID=A0AAV7JV67_9METZ|nr:Replication factor C subunit 2 [Oopsacas minuta]